MYNFNAIGSKLGYYIGVKGKEPPSKPWQKASKKDPPSKPWQNASKKDPFLQVLGESEDCEKISIPGCNFYSYQSSIHSNF